MKNHFGHICISVEDMEKSVQFYQEAFALDVMGRVEAPGAYLTWLCRQGDYAESGELPVFLELRKEKDREGACDKGENPTHFCILTDDVDALRERHRAMGIIDFETPAGIFFIKDPDGYSIEVASDQIMRGLL